MNDKTIFFIAIGGVLLLAGIILMVLHFNKPSLEVLEDNIPPQLLAGGLSNAQQTFTPYDSQPEEFNTYQISIDNGMKISYGNYYVTFQPYFVMENGNVFAWNDIPSTIQKDLWKNQVDWNKYKYGATFTNISQNIVDNLEYVVFHVSDSNGITFQDIEISGNKIIVKNKIVIDHDDFLKDFSIVKINKTDIVLGNIAGKNITVCDVFNDTTLECESSHTEFKSNYIYDNLTDSYSIIFDPTVILEGSISYASLDTNITQETGFAHLNTSTTAPYDSLQLYMPFDSNVSSTTVYDYTPNNNDGTLTNSPVFNSTGFIGGSYNYYGAGSSGVTGEYVEIGDNETLEFPAIDFTISGWYDLYSTSGSNYFMLGKRDGNGIGIGYDLAWRSASNGFQFTVEGAGNQYCQVRETSNTIGGWHHVTAVYYTSGQCSVFIDGVWSSNLTGSNSPDILDTVNAEPLLIGARTGAVYDFIWNGSIDEVMIFNTSLTPSQISDIYNNQSARFFNTGEMLFNDTNVSGDGTENRLNISLADYKNEKLSNISVEINTTWFNLSSDGTINNLQFTADPNKLNITFRYLAGTNSFYSPLMIGNITLDSWTGAGAPVNDTASPNVTSLTEPTDPSTYSFGASYEFNATITDDVSLDTVLFEFDGTNYTPSSSGSVYNYSASGLSVGTYNYNWFANDTSGNANNTEGGSFTINKAVPQGSLTGTSPITYGTAGDVEGTESNGGDSDVTYTLFRDNVSVSNPDTATLGAGTYSYIFNTTGGANYTSNASIGTFTLTINRANSEVNLALNSTESNITIKYGTTILLNGTLITGDATGTLTLYNNGTQINSGTTEVSNNTEFNNLGLHNITVIYSQSENYSQSYETYYVTVQDTTPPVFDNIRNFTHTVNTSFSSSITATDAKSSISGYFLNDTSVFSINISTGLITNNSALPSVVIYWLNISVNDTSGNVESGVFYINVTSIVDNDYPVFTSFIANPANNTAYVQGATYKFNATITSTNGSAGIEFNGVNYTASNVSGLFESSLANLGAGTYSYYWWGYGNGTLERYNTSSTLSYTVSKGASDLRLYLSGTRGNKSADNETQVNLTSILQTGGSENIQLYVNNTLWNNGTSPLQNLSTFATIGLYNITTTYGGNENYTSDLETWWLTITDASIAPVSQCGNNFTVLKALESTQRPYGRLCYWVEF